MARPRRWDKEAVKRAAQSYGWLRIFTVLGGVPAERLDGRGHACIRCGGGDDRFSCNTKPDGTIYLHCRKCDTHNGDELASLAWLLRLDVQRQFPEVLEKLAGHLNVEPLDRTDNKSFEPQDWNEAVVSVFCNAAPPISLPALVEAGAQLGRHGGRTAIAFPMHGQNGPNGGKKFYQLLYQGPPQLPVWKNGKIVERVSRKNSYKGSGIVGPMERLRKARVRIRCEGELDMLSVNSHLPEEYAAFCHTSGTKEPTAWMNRLFDGAEVGVSFGDCDESGRKCQLAWAVGAAEYAPTVKMPALPFEPGSKKDVRDYLNQFQDDETRRQKLIELIDSTTEFKPTEEQKNQSKTRNAAGGTKIDVERGLVEYGAVRNGNLWTVPMYGPDGEVVGQFKIPQESTAEGGNAAPSSWKGAGMFLPNRRRPQPGEQWCLVSGPLEAAAIASAEFGNHIKAIGIPRGRISDEYLRVFNGLFMPILICNNASGFREAVHQKEQLEGHAKEAWIVELPMSFNSGEALIEELNHIGQDQLSELIKTSRSPIPTVRLPGGKSFFTTITETATKLGILVSITHQYLTRDGNIVEVRVHKNGPPSIEPVKPVTFCSIFETVAVLGQYVEEKDEDGEANIRWQQKTCSESNGRLICNSPAFKDSLSKLKLVSSCPVLIERSGQLIVVTGFDEKSGIHACGEPPEDVSFEEAKKLINALFSDFKFATESDRSRAIAALITPVLIQGGLLCCRAPLDLGEADRSQSGKGFRNRLTAAVYRTELTVVTNRSNKSIGSLEEALDEALIKGRTLICLDNLRGTINSQAVESLLTEPRYTARAPFRPQTEIETELLVIMMTSNKAEMTDDLTKRSSCVRIEKQPPGYEFKKYPEGDLLAHVKANQPRFLGAVFAIVRAWHAAGKPQTRESRHDRKEWARTLDWIVQNLLGCTPLMDGHAQAQARMASKDLGWLRDVAAAIRRRGKTEEDLRVANIVSLLDEDATVEIPGLRPNESLNDDATCKRVFQTMGRRLSKCFRLACTPASSQHDDPAIDAAEQVDLGDGWVVERRQNTDVQYRLVYLYRVIRSRFSPNRAKETEEPRYNPADDPADDPANKTREPRYTRYESPKDACGSYENEWEGTAVDGVDVQKTRTTNGAYSGVSGIRKNNSGVAGGSQPSSEADERVRL